MIRVRKVAPLTCYPILADLQKECLPSDEPCHIRPGDIWFIGFRVYVPALLWALPHSIYWRFQCASK